MKRDCQIRTTRKRNVYHLRRGQKFNLSNQFMNKAVTKFCIPHETRPVSFASTITLLKNVLIIPIALQVLFIVTLIVINWFGRVTTEVIFVYLL